MNNSESRRKPDFRVSVAALQTCLEAWLEAKGARDLDALLAPLLLLFFLISLCFITKDAKSKPAGKLAGLLLRWMEDGQEELQSPRRFLLIGGCPHYREVAQVRPRPPLGRGGTREGGPSPLRIE